MPLENISLQSFRNMVQNAQVLDGDITLIANGKENQGVDLVKVNFGGKLRRIFSGTAGQKANDAASNIAVKERFFEVLKGTVAANGVDGEKFLAEAKKILGLEGERADKPLSRMTVKLLLDEADGKTPSFTAKHLNSFLDRVTQAAQPMLVEMGVSRNLLEERISFLRNEVGSLINNKAGADYLEKLFHQELTPEWVAKSILEDIARENKAGAVAEVEIDQSKYQFEVPKQVKAKKTTLVSNLREMFNSEGEAPIGQKKDIDDFDLKVSAKKTQSVNIERDQITLLRESILGKKDDSQEVKAAVDFATTFINGKIGEETFKAITAGKTLMPSFMLDIAEGLKNKTITKDTLSEFIAQNDNSFVNSSEVRSIMNDPKVKEAMNKVSIPEPQRSTSQKVRDFFADLAFSEDTWIHDGALSNADKLRSVLSKHADIIAQLNQQAAGTYGGKDAIIIGTFPLEPEMKIALKELLKGLEGIGTTAEDVRAALKDLSDEQLNGFNDRIIAAGDIACNRQQEEIAALFEKFSSGGDKVGASGYSLDAPKDVLDKYLAGKKGITGGKYGQFLSATVKMYFKSMPMIDKKAIFASSIRYAATPDQKLAAFFKGAGPIFQKMLQGLPADFGDKHFRASIADMKSRLSPIPQALVKYQLAKIIADSNGKIADIKVNKSLGAATVGQAFLCTITDDKGNSRECVVKLLRPDAKMRALREKDIFFTAASKTLGMREMFKSQFEGIMSELDLTKEAENIKMGDVYNKTGAKMGVDVGAMKLDQIAKPTTISLVAECAEGTTVDRFVEDVRKEVQDAIGKLVYLDVNGNISENEHHHIKYKPFNMQTGLIFTEVQKAIDLAYKKVHQAQAGLVNTSKVWTQEAFFGSGVIHGDMHSGNIMVKDGKVTIIDFGNATKIPSTSYVVGFTATTTMREPGDAVRIVKKMMPSNHPQVALLESAIDKYEAIRSGKKVAADFPSNPFDSMMEKLHEALVFDPDPNGETGDKDIGRRLTAALKIMQNEGVEIPAYLLTFMQSQDRLEATVNALNDLMIYIEKSYSTLVRLGPTNKIHSGSTLDIKLQVAKAIYDVNGSEQATIEDVFSTMEQGVYRLFGSDDEHLIGLESGIYQSFGAGESDKEVMEIANGSKLLSAQKFKELFNTKEEDKSFPTTHFLNDIAPLLHHNAKLREELNTTIIRKIDEFVANKDDEGFTKAVLSFAKKMKAAQTENWEFLNNYFQENAEKFGLTRVEKMGDKTVNLYNPKKLNQFGIPEGVCYKIDYNKFAKALIEARKNGVFGPKPEVVLPDFKEPEDFLYSLSEVVMANKADTLTSILYSLGFGSFKYSTWAYNGKPREPNLTIKMR